MEKVIQFIQNWFSKQTAAGKRKLALAATIAFAAVLTICVLVSINTGNTGSPPKNLPDDERVTIHSPVPAQELFLPDEPDFIPGVILGREQRSEWTEQDAAEYWQDPLRYGEEMWREKIENAIDELLERVP